MSRNACRIVNDTFVATFMSALARTLVLAIKLKCDIPDNSCVARLLSIREFSRSLLPIRFFHLGRVPHRSGELRFRGILGGSRFT